MEFKRKEKAQNCAFSVVPSQLQKLDDIVKHFDTTRSGAIQHLIEKEHLRLVEKKRIPARG